MNSFLGLTLIFACKITTYFLYGNKKSGKKLSAVYYLHFFNNSPLQLFAIVDEFAVFILFFGEIEKSVTKFIR